jgi:hypothetical protein
LVNNDENKKRGTKMENGTENNQCFDRREMDVVEVCDGRGEGRRKRKSSGYSVMNTRKNKKNKLYCVNLQGLGSNTGRVGLGAKNYGSSEQSRGNT